MVIYSGFSTRRQEQRYNNLTKQLLHLLSQLIITYIDSAKLQSFKQAYEKVLFEITKMDEHKYSELKISFELDSLTQHIVNNDFVFETISEQPKRKNQVKHAFRLKRNQESITRNVESANPKGRDRRSLSMSSDKKANRVTIGEMEVFREPTMQQLMRMNPLIQRKMSSIRKKRYMSQKLNNFPQIQEQDYQGQEKE